MNINILLWCIDRSMVILINLECLLVGEKVFLYLIIFDVNLWVYEKFGSYFVINWK